MHLLPGRGHKHTFNRWFFLRIGLLVVAGSLAFATLVTPITLRPGSFALNIGDVAPQDIRAPRGATFESNLLTDQARLEAAQAVTPVYQPADPSIARHQIERLRVTLAYITAVRADQYATPDQKLQDLSQLSDIQLSATTARSLLSFSDNRWDAIQGESLTILEQVMRDTIRDSNLADIKRNIPSLVNLSFSQEQASVISELVTGFLTPNSLYNPEQTATDKLTAQDAVAPVTRSFIAGETIVRSGQVITPTIHEALDYFGLIQPDDKNLDLLAAIALVLLLCVFLGLYFYRRRPNVINDMRSLVMISVVFLVFLAGARFVIPNRTILPYIYPIPAFGLTIVALYNMELGLVLSLVLSIVSAYGLPNSLDLTLFYVLSSLCGVLVLGKARRISSFFWSGVSIGAAGIATILAYRLTGAVIDWIGMATLAGAAVFNGLASASLALLIQFLFSQVLGLTTALQLLELSRPDHPLLQFVLRNAPGTYQHSLQVANLAEQAAEEIGADGLLTRVGALYHDCGKAMNSSFFIENQVPGKLNPHDDLDPETSAATIIRHVEDGLTLARKYHLPPRLRDFINEHHGTMLTRYQYHRAVEMAAELGEEVDPDCFRYPGPRPQSRETALIMLADNCEARARAQLPKNENELTDILKYVFDLYQQEGQLDDTRMTLKDLSVARQSFAASLRGIYHPRILYPELKPLPDAVNPAQLPPGTPTDKTDKQLTSEEQPPLEQPL